MIDNATMLWMNPAIDKELLDRRVEDRANVSSSALRCPVLVSLSMQKFGLNFLKRLVYILSITF